MWSSTHFIAYSVWKKGGTCANSGSGLVPPGACTHLGRHAEVLRARRGGAVPRVCGWGAAAWDPDRREVMSAPLLWSHFSRDTSFIVARTGNSYQLSPSIKLNSLFPVWLGNWDQWSEVSSSFETLDCSSGLSPSLFPGPCWVYFSDALAYWTKDFYIYV